MNNLKFVIFLGFLLLASCNTPAKESTDDPETESQAVPTATPEVIVPTTAAAESVIEPAVTQTPTTGPESDESSSNDARPVEEDEPISSGDTVLKIAADPQEISVSAADALSLAGTFYPAKASSDARTPGLLLLHMNGGRRQDWGESAKLLAERGYSVLSLDMRGHGQTGGVVDWVLAEDDLKRAWQYLVDKEEVDETKTAIIGASIGANMALSTGAALPSVQTVVVLSPGLDYFGVKTDDKVAGFGSRPIMIVASTEDKYSAESSEVLSELALGEAKLVMYDGAGHGTRMLSSRPDLQELIVEWLGKHLAPAVDSRDYPLFDVAWNDRTIFDDGLIDSDKQILQGPFNESVYHLDLAFSNDMSSLDGLMALAYTNNEDSMLENLYFHLYPNRLGGEMSVGQVRVDGQIVDPKFSAANTVMSVPLPLPLVPGEDIGVDMEFNLEIPRDSGINFGLLTASEEALALAHFYPQLAVFDQNGWNIDIPPGIPDITYADSAYYLVRVSAPGDQTVIGSGRQVNRETAGQGQTVAFAAGPVRDFYLAAGPDYTSESLQVGETTINSYLRASAMEDHDLALDAAGEALALFNQSIGPYPFTELDVVAMPTLAGGFALGIEYPGIVVINSDLYIPGGQVGRSGTPSSILLESTIAHEVGHQWFYSTVGNDQVDEPWLDESLVQYITYQYYRNRYGDQAAEGFRDSLVNRWGQVEFENTPIGRPAGDYAPGAYGAIVYGRGPLFFEALAQEMGEDSFDRFLSDYYTQNKWGIATGEGLRSLAEAHCGCDLTGLFAEWVIGT